jgi:hypothetical protein
MGWFYGFKLHLIPTCLLVYHTLCIVRFLFCGRLYAPCHSCR